VTLSTILRFQFGEASAIEAVAKNRAALLTGIVLVLLTAVARNYDQAFVMETPFWVVGSLLFSFFSGSFLFLVLYMGFIRRHFPAGESRPPASRQWLCFMGLFWMTAPVAWLYAIPVERFFDSYRAAQANLALLGVVALWRVLLMARIISVLQGLRFIRSLGWVLIPASIEVLLVVFFGTLFSPSFGRRVMSSMSGMRNAPEENLLMSGLDVALKGAVAILILTIVVLALRRFQGTVRSFPAMRQSRMPVLGLAGLTIVWVLIAIPAQIEQQRFLTHARLIERGAYRESIDYLARYSPHDFPPSRRLEPNAYEYRVYRHLPEIMNVLEAADPEWIRNLHLEQMEILFSHHWFGEMTTEFLSMFLALERLPEPETWIERNREHLSKLKPLVSVYDRSEPEDFTPERELLDVLMRLGADPSAW
jgi:hypothetical protein